MIHDSHHSAAHRAYFLLLQLVQVGDPPDAVARDEH